MATSANYYGQSLEFGSINGFSDCGHDNKPDNQHHNRHHHHQHLHNPNRNELVGNKQTMANHNGYVDKFDHHDSHVEDHDHHLNAEDYIFDDDFSRKPRSYSECSDMSIDSETSDAHSTTSEETLHGDSSNTASDEDERKSPSNVLTNQSADDNAGHCNKVFDWLAGETTTTLFEASSEDIAEHVVPFCKQCLAFSVGEEEADELTETLLGVATFMGQLRDALEVLCSERLGQMTKTYNDIECVTRLLEEKERDLELAARIGQSLLEKNKSLEAKNDRIQGELDDALEKIRQLQHDLHTKEALLQIYNQDEDSPSPVLEAGSLQNPLLVNMEMLQNKVKALELENFKLTVEQSSLQTETYDLEEKEAGLVKDCVKQLSDANEVIRGLEDELAIKADGETEKHEELTLLQGKLATMEQERKAYLIEHADLQKHLEAAKEAQKELTAELAELEQRYDECMAALMEAQEDNRTLKKKSRPSAIHQHYGTTPFYMPEGSLAMELERSMQSEEDVPEGYKPKQRRSHNRRVMATARAVRMAASNTGSTASLNTEDEGSNRSSMYLSDGDSYISDGDTGLSMLGRAGIPGSNDLETALRRLTANDINDKQYEEEREEKHQQQSEDGFGIPSGWTTPESFMSMGSGSTDFSRSSSFRMPEKLQIVKPMEGSATLHKWQRLATPRDLCGLLEARPVGVQNKTEEPEKFSGPEEIYSLSDYEEDEEYSCPNRADNDAAATYTYTTAKVMHPDDHFMPYSDDKSSTKTSSAPTSSQSTEKPKLSLPLTLTHSPNHNSSGTSTYSMSLGLARELHERSLSPRGMYANPPRFQMISSETRASDPSGSHTQQPEYTNASLFVSPLPCVNDSAAGSGGASSSPMRYRPENAYLNLVDKIKDIGFKSIMNIAEDSHIMPPSPSKNAVDVGLNSVMFMKRQSWRLRRRSGKYAPQLSIVTAVSVATAASSNSVNQTLRNGDKNNTLSLDLNKDKKISPEKGYNISPPSGNTQFAQLPAYMCPVPGSAALAQSRVAITSSCMPGGAGVATNNTASNASSSGSVSSIPSLAELKSSSSKDCSRQPLSSILEKPILEGIATRVGLGAAAAALRPKPSKKS